MKKLMIAAAIVCAAVISQAATTEWAFYTSTVFKDGYNKDGASSYSPVKIEGATLYLLSVADSGWTTQDSLYQDLMGGKKSIADIKGLALATGQTDSDGKVSTASAFSREDATIGQDYYYAIFAATDDGKYVFFSASKDAPALDNKQTSQFSPSVLASNSFKTTENVSAAGWYAAAVPEPTSGLLLLLGVAGLALRRRRA